MAEKAKNKELQDMHRNIIQLLNATYTGEDNLEKILDFLENQCQIKRSDIDEASLIRAKQLYFKKVPVPSTHRSNSPLPIPDEVILSGLSRNPSRDNLIPVSNGKVRLPALSLEKAKRNPSKSPLPTDEISTAKSTGKPKVLTGRHFKNNSESFARKTTTNILNSPSPFMSPGSTFSGYGKSPTRTARVNEAGGFFITKQRDPGALLTARDNSSYQPYSTSGFGLTANTNLKLDSKFSFSPSPTIPSVLSALNTARPGLGEDKLSIGQDENTIRSPFFVTNRSELNRDVFLAEVFPKKIYQGPSISSLFNSSNGYDTIKKPTKNFVALHSKGFQTSENVDLFNHVLRLLLKNHHILKSDLLSDKPKVTKQSSSNSGSNDEDEDSVEYVPIEIKQFVLETSQKELEALDSVILMYEKHTGSRINTNENLPKSPEEGYNINKLEEEMSKENEYLEQVLKRINDHGVESVSLNQMIKFKQIMKRRFEIFTRLQTHIEVSGLLRTKPLTSREVQLKEELKQTFRKIKKITALKPIFAFYEPTIKSSSQSGGSSPHKNPGSQSARTPHHARHDSFAHASDNMLNSIKRSIETTKTLDRVAKAFRNDHGPGSPIQESLMEAEGGRSTKLKGKKVPKKTRSYNSLTPHGDSAIKTWGDVIGFESNMSLKGADFEGGPSVADFERKGTLASIVYEAKKKRRTSFTETKEDHKERQRVLLSRGEAKTVNVLTEGERKRRLERLLAKPGGSVALPLETEEDDEEIKEDRNRRRMEIKEIERAWREKDFEFLKTYLKAPTIKVSTNKATEEDDDESKVDNKVGTYERKKSKKKKKVNPNIRTNSGGVAISAKSLRKLDSNSRDLADDLSDEDAAEKSEEESDDLIVEEDDDEDLFSPFFKKEIKSPSLVKDKPEFHIDIHATKGKTMLSLTNRRSESRIITKPSPRTPAPGGASEKIKIIAELKKQAHAKITRKFAPSKKAATHETKLSLDKPLTPKGKRQSTRSDLGASIQGDSMGFSVWQKAENTLDRIKNDTISIENKYGLGEQQILEQTLEDKDKDKNKKLKEIVEDWKFIQDFKPPPLNLKRGSLKIPTQIKKEDGTNSEIGSATPVPRNYLMSPGNGNRASLFLPTDGSRPKTDDKMTIKSFPSKNDNGDDGTSSRLKTEEQKKELNISGLGKWSEGNRSPLNESKITEKSIKNLSMNKSIEKSLIANMPSPVHSPASKIVDKSTESPKKGNTKTKVDKETPKNKTGKTEKADKDKKKEKSEEQENEGKGGKSKSKETEKAKEPEKKLLDIKKMNTQSVIAEEPELKLEEQKSVVVVKTNVSVSRAEITSPIASLRLSITKVLQESILIAKSPTHDRSPIIPEEEIIQSVEEVESPATASIGKVLEELPSPMKKPKRVKVIKKSELLPPEPEPEIVLSKKRLTRTSIRTDLGDKKPEDLLDDPIALLNSVLKVHEVDHETKLDLFLYGNRKEALKDFVKEIEETIEHNVLKQEECGEQLDDFFDKRLNSMLTDNSSSLFPKQNAANFDAHHLWKRSSTRLIRLDEDDAQNAQGNPYLRKAFREYEDERLRRQAFLHGPIIVNHLKSTDQRKVKALQQGCMSAPAKDIRNGKVILSPDCLEIMLQNKGETLLQGAGDDEEDNECSEYRKERRMQEKEEMELLARIERIRRFLRELKKRDPPYFRELVQSFYQNKKFYDFVMKDIEAKKIDRVLEPLNNSDDPY